MLTIRRFAYTSWRLAAPIRELLDPDLCRPFLFSGSSWKWVVGLTEPPVRTALSRILDTSFRRDILPARWLGDQASAPVPVTDI
jgi:hypothetical protein